MLEERLWPRDGAGARVKLFDGTSVAAIVMEVGAENIDLSVRTNAHRLRDTEGTAADLQWNTDASHVYAVGTILKVDQGPARPLPGALQRAGEVGAAALLRADPDARLPAAREGDRRPAP